MKKGKRLFQKHRELVMYVFFGGLTTVVNWVAYMACVSLLGGNQNTAAVLWATVIGQVLSIVFAYVTNRKWVFQSKARGLPGIAAEAARFFGCRGVSFFLDIGLMYVGVTLLGVNDAWMKLLANVVIIAANFLLSKCFVFREARAEGKRKGVM